MSKVRVTNICKDQCVGLSFTMLRPNQYSTVEDSKISEADMRMEKKGLISITKDPGTIKIDNNDVEEKTISQEEENINKESAKEKIKNDDDNLFNDDLISNTDSKNIIKAKSLDDNKDENNTVTNDTVEKNDKIINLNINNNNENTNLNNNTNDNTDNIKESVNILYTKDALNTFSRKQLIPIAKNMGVIAKSKNDIIEGILLAQEQNNS